MAAGEKISQGQTAARSAIRAEVDTAGGGAAGDGGGRARRDWRAARPAERQTAGMAEGATAEVPKESCDGLHDPGEEADDDSEKEDAE